MVLSKITRATIVVCAMVFSPIFVSTVALADCPDRPACSGCGCKGGPGYRGPDGKCVSHKNLERVCGDPATSLCVFENAPGTGANRSCALGLDEPDDQINSFKEE